MLLLFVCIIIILIIIVIPNKKKDNKSVKYKEDISNKNGNNKNNIEETYRSYIKLAGARYYKINGRLQFKIDDTVYLFKEPNNAYGKDAIKIVNIHGLCIGHVPSEYTSDINHIFDENYYIHASINSIDRKEPKYPYVQIKLYITKDRSIINLTDEELDNLDTLSENKIIEKENNYLKSIEFFDKAILLEKDGNTPEAIKYFEESIKYNETQSKSFDKLIAYYRKNRDRDNEIRVVKKAIDFYRNSIDKYNKDYYIYNFKERLLKLYEIKANMKNKKTS